MFQLRLWRCTTKMSVTGTIRQIDNLFESNEMLHAFQSSRSNFLYNKLFFYSHFRNHNRMVMVVVRVRRWRRDNCFYCLVCVKERRGSDWKEGWWWKWMKKKWVKRVTVCMALRDGMNWKRMLLAWCCTPKFTLPFYSRHAHWSPQLLKVDQELTRQILLLSNGFPTSVSFLTKNFGLQKLQMISMVPFTPQQWHKWRTEKKCTKLDEM